MSHNRVQKAILPDGRRCFHCKMLSFLFLPYKIGLSENQGYVLMSGFPVDMMTYNNTTQCLARTLFKYITFLNRNAFFVVHCGSKPAINADNFCSSVVLFLTLFNQVSFFFSFFFFLFFLKQKEMPEYFTLHET